MPSKTYSWTFLTVNTFSKNPMLMYGCNYVYLMILIRLFLLKFVVWFVNYSSIKAKKHAVVHSVLLFCVFSVHCAHCHGLLALPFQTQVHRSTDCITLTDEHSVKLELDLFI